MLERFKRVDGETLESVTLFAEQCGCSVETALKFLLKIGRYPQEAGEDDETYAARLESLADPDVVTYKASHLANEA